MKAISIRYLKIKILEARSKHEKGLWRVDMDSNVLVCCKQTDIVRHLMISIMYWSQTLDDKLKVAFEAATLTKINVFRGRVCGNFH